MPSRPPPPSHGAGRSPRSRPPDSSRVKPARRFPSPKESAPKKKVAGSKKLAASKKLAPPKKRASKEARPEARAKKPTVSAKAPPAMAPEEYLARAMGARTAKSRGLWARRGLAARARIDRETHALLLRQVYLAHFEQREFRAAFDLIHASLRLGALKFEDVLHHDAARAAAALGDIDRAARHLRRAARVGPPSNRALHWWTLGSYYWLAGRNAEAIGALERAARWGTRDKPLYQGHLALARIAMGEEGLDTQALIERLAAVPAGQGYGRFVLGMLSFHDRRFAAARSFLQAFIERTEQGPPVRSVALDGELACARRTLVTLGVAPKRQAVPGRGAGSR